jgi:hypothetical protein
MESFRRNVLRVVAPLAVLSFAICIWQTQASPQAAYYLLPSRAWELAVGGILALTLPKQANRAPVLGGLISAAGVIAVVGSALWLNGESAFPGYNALYPTLGTGAVILGGALSTRSPIARFLSCKPMTFVGLLSYSWYLWHWPLLSLARNYALHEDDMLRDVLLGGVLAFVLAALTYYFLEDPVRKKRPGPFAAVPSTLWTGAAISVVMAGGAFALALNAKYIGSRDQHYTAAVAARYDVPPMRKTCNHERDGDFKTLNDRKRCTIGDPNHITAVLWGDSHADHLSSLMQAFVRERPNDGGILQRSFSSCRPIAAFAPRITLPSETCLAFNKAVLDEAAQLRAQGLKGIVLSSMWVRVFDDTWEEKGFKSAEEKYAYAEHAIDAVVTQIESLGLRVLIAGPVTHLSRSAPQCLARFTVEECSESRQDQDAERQPALEALRRIASAHPRTVQLWDPIDQLCDSERCPVRMGSVVMFTDAVHLSASGARQLLESADPHLDWLVGDQLTSQDSAPHVARQ